MPVALCQWIRTNEVVFDFELDGQRMDLETGFTCGHCEGTSNCNCDECRKGEQRFYSDDSEARLLESGKARRYSYDYNYYACSACNGTGRILPTFAIFEGAGKFSKEETKAQIKRLEALRALEEQQSIRSAAKKSELEAGLQLALQEAKNLEAQIKLQELKNNAPQGKKGFFG